MRIAYADPPYPGMSGFYRDHPDYAGEVDHGELVSRLLAEFDGFVLHTASVTLDQVLAAFPASLRDLGCRIGSWTKTFASFKKNVAVAYAWEPVIFKPCRMREYDGMTTVRDWIAEPITLRRGLTGAKPEAVCRWAFDVVGAEPEDELFDLYPGTGAVSAAWDAWSRQTRLTA